MIVHSCSSQFFEDSNFGTKLSCCSCNQLSSKVINMRELRRITSLGIPDGAGIRPVVWKVISVY